MVMATIRGRMVIKEFPFGIVRGVMIQDMGGDVIREKGKAGKGANGVFICSPIS